MLRDILKHRIKDFTAVYVEPQRVEMLKGSRQWRTWQVEAAETHTASEGEGVFDLLQRLNVRPRGRKGNALIVVVSRTFYSCHREHYPLALGAQIHEAVDFDWQENIFYEHDSTIHFFAPPVPVENQFSVAIFSIQNDIHNKFYQAFNGGAFETFAVIPSALAYKASLPPVPEGEAEPHVQVMARVLTRSQLEVCRFFNGELLDSMLLGKSPYDIMIFSQRIKNGHGGEELPPSLPIHLLTSRDEPRPALPEEFSREGLHFEVQPAETSLIDRWMRHFLEQDAVRSFERDLLFKPWEVPRVVWPMAAMVALFSLFSFYQVHSHDTLKDRVRIQRQQVMALEKEWKPIEELQTRIAKFEEDQKTLAEFNSRSIPLLDLMNFLAAMTPEDTWLNYLSLRNDKLMLRGESKSAIRYLSDLSKLEGFSDVRFASPVTRNPTSDQERFNLQLQIETAKLMETLAKMPRDEGEAEGEDLLGGELEEVLPGTLEEEGQGVLLEPEGSEDEIEVGEETRGNTPRNNEP